MAPIRPSIMSERVREMGEKGRREDWSERMWRKIRRVDDDTDGSIFL